MELIKHECGIGMIRLRRPLQYYKEKYGSEFWGLNKLYLIMEKEHNRGQEGAGVGCVKLGVRPGNEYIFRERAEGSDAIRHVFDGIHRKIEESLREAPEAPLPFLGEVYMGHLRYSTTGRSGISYVHPFMRRNNWSARNMLLCGNFNMTNVESIFREITAKGQHPRIYSDAFILLEQLGHALDMENERVYRLRKADGLEGLQLAEAIARDIDVRNVLRRCAPSWDGGYVICGIVGNGDMWVVRDPNGIRPCFYYMDDEVVVVASERPVIQTAFNLRAEQVRELEPGEAVIVDMNGGASVDRILEAREKKACSFERIYFSRGSDKDIYKERKELGKRLVPRVLQAVNNDLDHTVLSFIPNTAEVAYMGLVEGMEDYLMKEKEKELCAALRAGTLTQEMIQTISHHRVRKEKVAIKDIKLRTFIAQGDTRNDLAAHVYDITYGTITPGVDYLVSIDDSIVRGTTLKQSIIRILDRLSPRKIVIVSSSPQVRYPDCYGIDMSRLGEFIAFRAAMELLRERGMEDVVTNAYEKCLRQDELPDDEVRNYVKDIYAPFTDEEISAKISEMLRPEDTDTEVEIVYQTIENLHRSIPGHKGDWYFSGDYPTPGGVRLVNRAFINFVEGNIEKRN